MEGNDEGEPNLLPLPGGSELLTPVTKWHKPHHMAVVILINIRSVDEKKTSHVNEHNYLKRFRQIYEEKGWITVQCTPTEDRVDRGEAAEVVSTMFECLQNRRVHRHPIIVHVLGDKAIPVHNAVCQFVKDELDLGNLISIKGCILDSCPKQPDGVIDSLKEFWPFLYELLILMIYMIQVLYPELFSKDPDNSDYDEFCYNSGNWPQLYLYSTVDHIVPHKGVEKAISVRGSLGIPLETKCWSDTEHARHLFVHEKEYTELCQKFVHRCLECY